MLAPRPSRSLVVRIAAGAMLAFVALIGGSAPAPALAAAPNDDIADRVFGLPDPFAGALCNAGGTPSAHTVCNPTGIAIRPDGGNLWLADTQNHRVLIYQSPLSTDATADAAYGLFDAALCNRGLPAPTGSTVCAPSGVAFDGNSLAYIADTLNNRVLIEGAANSGIGQPNLTTNVCNNGGVTALSLCGPSSVAVDGAGNLYVADESNHRVLQYNTPLPTDKQADRVFGQGGSFSSSTPNNGGVSTNSLFNPRGVAVGADGTLYVSDSGNNRVLAFDDPLTTDTTADRVYGQTGSFVTGACNNGGISADSLCSPRSITFDAQGRMYVADLTNHRVLAYDPAADTTADLVFGQGGFATGGAICSPGTTTGLCGPSGVAVDAYGTLFVTERNASRMRAYFSPFTTDAVTDRSFGQPSPFTHAAANVGGVSARSLNLPTGVVVDGAGNVYVGDQLNHRVLEYDTPLTTDMVADRVFGQGLSFLANTCNNGGISQNSLCQPSQLALDSSGNLYVVDLSNNRVLVYFTPLTTDTTADLVFGQGGSFLTGTCNKDGISASSLCPGGIVVDSDDNLYIADFHNSRVLEFDTPLTTNTVADRVYGQASFTANTCNAGGISASTLCQPAGLAVDAANNLYVADWANSRALKYMSPLTDAAADVVYGQAGSMVSAACNLAGRSTISLCNPRDVEVTSTGEVYISDQFNNRVLRYPVGADIAVSVFGQYGSFTSGDCNAPGTGLGIVGMSARTLCSPGQLATDSLGRLYVADVGNHRVLEFDVFADIDADGVTDASDTCPTVLGAQTNTDAAPLLTPGGQADDTIAMSDALGDLCDTDDDNDYLPDTTEAAGAPCASASAATNPLVQDTDGDRWIDGAECAIGTNPASFASKPTSLGQGNPSICPETPDHDDDGDRLKNSFELTLGTNRCDPDSDDDGILDGTEYFGYGTSPFALDSDLDGLRDCVEVGDVNGNENVNAQDLGLVAAQNTRTDRPVQDVDKNGIVNAADLGTVARAFPPGLGGTCPP